MSETPEYEDLSLFDASSEEELLDTAVDRMQVSLPEWVPDESNTEMVLLEALCVLIGMSVYELNELPQTVVGQLLEIYGVTRDGGTAATGVVEFTMSGAEATQEVPEGTTLRWTDEDTGLSYDFTTTETVTVQTSDGLTGTAHVVAEDVGADVNGVGNVPVDVLDGLPEVDSARIIGTLAGGVDPEDDETYFDRGAALFARQTSTLVLPEQFTMAALTHSDVERANSYTLLNPDKPGVETLGHMTVVLAGASGEALAEERMEAIRVELVAQAIAGLTVHVEAPVATDVWAQVSVVKNSSAVMSDVEANVKAALSEYFSPEEWDWHSDVSVNEVVGVAAQADGVAYVQTLNLYDSEEQTDARNPLTLKSAGYGSLPNLKAVTVTVVNG